MKINVTTIAVQLLCGLLFLSGHLSPAVSAEPPAEDRMHFMRGRCQVEVNGEDLSRSCPNLLFRMILYSKQRLAVIAEKNGKDTADRDLMVGFSGGFVFRTSDHNLIMEVDRLYLGKGKDDFEPARGKCVIRGDPFAKDHYYECDAIGTRSLAQVKFTFQVQTTPTGR